MTTIFVNKIKNNQGGNNVKVNQLSGIDTAGSITVQGEGSNTTNLQQGLIKSWARVAGSASGAPATTSLNVSGTTDSGNGNYEVAYTANFSNGEYCITIGDSHNANVSSATHSRCNTSSSSGLGLESYYNGALEDPSNLFYQNSGDLA